MNEVLYLVSKNVPWEVAWDLGTMDRRSMVVALAIQDGAKFDFKRGQFIDQHEQKPMRPKR